MSQLDSKQQKVYDSLKLLQPCMIASYTSFQMSFASPGTPMEYVLVSNNMATTLTGDTKVPEYQEIVKLYNQAQNAINTRSILLEIQEKVANIYVNTYKTHPHVWQELENFAEEQIIGQRMFGLRDNIEQWSEMMSVYIPKSK